MFKFVCYITLLPFIVLECNTLHCRSDGGPTEEELKAVYKSCLKRQDERNSSETRAFPDDQDWKESRGRFNQRTQWNMEDRDDRMGDRGGRMGSRRDRTRSRDDRENARERMGGNRNSEDRMVRDDDRMGGRDGVFGSNGRMDNVNYHSMMGKSDGFADDQDGYPKNDEFVNGMPQYHGYHSTTPSSRRYKRSKQTNSGQRSQYNPNPKHSFEEEDTNGDDNKNSSISDKDMENKACALHCFVEQLKMTDENGMPDRYLVTHTITKDVKNEELKDFLQESIEECFQLIENENTEDNCEFSKNLMMCLSEKGRANCDDWKEDLKF